MPRPTPRSSAIRAPLDFILGTQGGVRALRVLCATTVPLSQSELSRRAGLSLSGVPALLATLETAGIISYTGRGRTRQVQLHGSHPLADDIRRLFARESERWNLVQQRLRGMVGAHAEGLVAAWIEGTVSEGTDRFTDPIVVVVLAAGLLPLPMQENLRRTANTIQSELHVMVALRTYQRADLIRFSSDRRRALVRAIPLYGPVPVDLLVPTEAKKSRASQNAANEQSRTSRAATPEGLAKRVAERLVKEPETIARALAFIERRLAIAGAAERLALVEWQGLLESLSARQVAALLVEESERADALRQNMPFVDALGVEEARPAKASKRSKRSAAVKTTRARPVPARRT